MFSKELFCNRLKTLRLEKKLTLEQLGLLFNVTKQTTSRWETGDRIPSIEIIYVLAEFFEVSLDYLTGRTNMLNNQANTYGNTDDSNYTECKSNNDNIQNDITEDEQELVSDFRILDVHEKYIIKGRIAEMIYNKDIEQSEFSDELCNINLMDKLNK